MAAHDGCGCESGTGERRQGDDDNEAGPRSDDWRGHDAQRPDERRSRRRLRELAIEGPPHAAATTSYWER